MKRYEPFTEDLCQKLKQDVTAALEPLAEKHGICLDLVKEFCADDGESVSVNLRFTLPERAETVASRKEENDFRCYAEGFGMRASWLGKEFQRGNFTYKVAGLKINAPKECVILQRSDGSRCQEEGKLVARYLS